MRAIPFNKPVTTDVESGLVQEALASAKLSGDGPFTKRCQEFFRERYGFGKALLTTSCTDALEMCALLLDLTAEDEVIIPSFTFVSSANAFALRGARLRFADSGADNPNITAATVEPLITARTRAIVVVHYAGVACDMDSILELAADRNIAIVEDAAQAVDSFYKGRPLGAIGTTGAFSFHETKNLSCGEGGMFVTNDQETARRAEIIREKGTNRSAFLRGDVDKYGWVDLGSSFLPSDILAAYLCGQTTRLDAIQNRRKEIWSRYLERLVEVEKYGISLPAIPNYATNNAHMFYLVCRSLEQRSALISDLRDQEIFATFHYLSLHSSRYFRDRYDGPALVNSDRYTDCLVRLPLHLAMDDKDVDRTADAVIAAVSG